MRRKKGFRYAGVTAFAGYSLALMQNSIWFNARGTRR
jgi:hypothetical protein